MPPTPNCTWDLQKATQEKRKRKEKITADEEEDLDLNLEEAKRRKENDPDHLDQIDHHHRIEGKERHISIFLPNTTLFLDTISLALFLAINHTYFMQQYPKISFSLISSLSRSTTKEDKLNEPLKIDTTTNQDILEVDQPSASSGIGPSPKNDSESPKVTIYLNLTFF